MDAHLTPLPSSLSTNEAMIDLKNFTPFLYHYAERSNILGTNFRFTDKEKGCLGRALGTEYRKCESANEAWISFTGPQGHYVHGPLKCFEALTDLALAPLQVEGCGQNPCVLVVVPKTAIVSCMPPAEKLIESGLLRIVPRKVIASVLIRLGDVRFEVLANGTIAVEVEGAAKTKAQLQDNVDQLGTDLEKIDMDGVNNEASASIGNIDLS